MNLTKDQAAVHMMLHGWSLVTYKAGFTLDTGYGVLSSERHEWLRTSTNQVIVRSKALPLQPPDEVSVDDVPSYPFWRLFDRLMLLKLVPEIEHYRNYDVGFGRTTV